MIREPEPVAAEGTLVFPDFALQHRHDRRRRFLLELVGFWTRDYLDQKLRRLRAASLSNLILAVDEERNVGDADLPPCHAVLRFRRRLDAGAVLEALARGGEAPRGATPDRGRATSSGNDRPGAAAPRVADGHALGEVEQA